MKKLVISTLAAGVVMLVVSLIAGYILSVIFPSLAKEYTNPSLFRPWSDPIMSLFYLYPFILAAVLVILWDKTKKLVSGKTPTEKAVRFGLMYWLFTNTTGMFISYSTFPVSLTMVVSWSLSSLITILGGSLVIAKMVNH